MFLILVDGGNGTNSEDVIVPDNMILKNSSEFSFHVYASLATCRSWDSVKEQWVLAGCSVSKVHNYTELFDFLITYHFVHYYKKIEAFHISSFLSSLELIH